MSLLTLLMLTLSIASPTALPAHDGIAVVVVRHAEKDDDDKLDPSLAGNGEVRAQALAATLAGAGLDRAIATQFRRTRDTAAPAAAGIDVEVREINGDNAATYASDLAADLRAMPAGSTVLVVGHSNTVPGIVEALSGQAPEAMPETEYDRYTLVLLDADGGARVITSRY